jgi:hypothetical protein
MFYVSALAATSKIKLRKYVYLKLPPTIHTVLFRDELFSERNSCYMRTSISFNTGGHKKLQALER